VVFTIDLWRWRKAYSHVFVEQIQKELAIIQRVGSPKPRVGFSIVSWVFSIHRQRDNSFCDIDNPGIGTLGDLYHRHLSPPFAQESRHIDEADFTFIYMHPLGDRDPRHHIQVFTAP
jgi:hypothetical protein